MSREQKAKGQPEAEMQQLTRLASDIYTTHNDELHGNDIEQMMILAAEARLSEEESQQRYPAMWHHFRFDRDALAEYRLMKELVELEATDQLAVPAQLPATPTEHSSLLSSTRDVVAAIFAGFQSMAGSLTRGESLGVEPVEVTLIPDALFLELDVEVSERDTNLRDLFCRVEAEEKTLAENMEHAPIWLQVGADGPITRETTLSDLGDARFTALEPATYQLHLQLRAEHYVIVDVVLP